MLKGKRIKTVIIANIPSPYRVFYFNKLADSVTGKFMIYYCAHSEPNRRWNPPQIEHNHLFLKKSKFKLWNRSIYWNADIWTQLKMHNPDIIVTGGFNPTMLAAILFAKVFKKKLFVNTDSWSLTEKEFSIFHIMIRKVVYRYITAALPVGEKGRQNFLSYGVPDQKIFKVPYNIENNFYAQSSGVEKKYDIMFSGQFIQRKMPYFFLEVVEKLNKKKKNIKILLLGSGPLQDDILKILKKINVSFNYPGFVQQNELPAYYGASKLFLFPTEVDGWGVVANEACASGLPVITCENAGAADDLVVHKYNGFVLPLKVDAWVSHVCMLLDDQSLYEKFSKNSIKQAQKFSTDFSINNMLAAIKNAYSNESMSK
ncbi:MAG: glycosyltransferase [Calditrichaeota bacterium]|nr:MAG: glycosyltransferase [Calditrichota bacterium]